MFSVKLETGGDRGAGDRGRFSVSSLRKKETENRPLPLLKKTISDILVMKKQNIKYKNQDHPPVRLLQTG